VLAPCVRSILRHVGVSEHERAHRQPDGAREATAAHAPLRAQATSVLTAREIPSDTVHREAPTKRLAAFVNLQASDGKTALSWLCEVLGALHPHPRLEAGLQIAQVWRGGRYRYLRMRMYATRRSRAARAKA